MLDFLKDSFQRFINENGKTNSANNLRRARLPGEKSTFEISFEHQPLVFWFEI